jgi:hypothetical protein
MGTDKDKRVSIDKPVEAPSNLTDMPEENAAGSATGTDESTEDKKVFEAAYGIQLLASADFAEVMLVCESVPYVGPDGESKILNTPQDMARILVSEMNMRLSQSSLASTIVATLMPEICRSVSEIIGGSFVNGKVILNTPEGKKEIPLASFLADINARYLLKLIADQQQVGNILTKMGGKIIH